MKALKSHSALLLIVVIINLAVYNWYSHPFQDLLVVNGNVDFALMDLMDRVRASFTL